MAPTMAERVAGLIEGSGMTRRAFAARIGLDESKLSKSLGGVRRFSSLDLARVAQECHVTVDWLITGEEPLLAVAARTTSGNTGDALRLARRYCTMRADLACLGYAQPWHGTPGLPAPGEATSGSATEDGRRLAADALEFLDKAGCSMPCADLVVAIEEVFGADVAVEPLGPGFDGAAASSPQARLILLATSHIPGRQRFTLAHELGHLLAGDDHGVHLDRDVLDGGQAKDPSEIRANAFASAFLMPEALLREALARGRPEDEVLAALACDLRVTPSALAFRLRGLGLLDAGGCDRLRAMTGAQAAALAGDGERFALLVASAGTRRAPGLLLRDAYAAYEAGQATLRPYASLLGTDVAELASALDSERDAPEP